MTDDNCGDLDAILDDPGALLGEDSSLPPIPEMYPGFREHRRRNDEFLAARYDSPEDAAAARKRSWSKILGLFRTDADSQPRDPDEPLHTEFSSLNDD